MTAEATEGATTELGGGERYGFRFRFFGSVKSGAINIKKKVPIYVAASGPKTLELAGEIADGVILFGAVSPSLIDFVMNHKEHEPLVTEKMIRATTLTGTHDEVIAAIQNMKKAGIHQVAIQPVTDTRVTIETFAREIMRRMK